MSLTLDMDERTLEFQVQGRPPKTVMCSTASSLRFAVAMKLQAAVRILDEFPPYPPVAGGAGGEVAGGTNNNAP